MRVLTAVARPSLWLACIASCGLLVLAVVPQPKAQSGLDELATITITLAHRMKLDAAYARFDVELALLELRIAAGMERPMGCGRSQHEAARERLAALKREQAELQRRIEHRRASRVSSSKPCRTNPLATECP